MGRLWTEKDEARLKALMDQKREANRREQEAEKIRQEAIENFEREMREDAGKRSAFLERIGVDPNPEAGVSEDEFFAMVDANERDVLRRLDAIREKDFWRMVDDKRREILSRFGIGGHKDVAPRVLARAGEGGAWRGRPGRARPSLAASVNPNGGTFGPRNTSPGGAQGGCYSGR